MAETIHMCVCIAGILRRSDKELSDLFTEPDGSHKPGRYVREWLKLQLAQGKRVLPMGDCDNFDFQTGCKGHPMTEAEAIAAFGEGAA